MFERLDPRNSKFSGLGVPSPFSFPLIHIRGACTSIYVVPVAADI